MLDAMEANGAQTSAPAAAEATIRFHDAVYGAGKHRLLMECWERMRPLLHMLMLSYAVAQPEFLATSISQQRALLDALRAHDEDRAAALTGQHARVALETVRRYYGEDE